MLKAAGLKKGVGCRACPYTLLERTGVSSSGAVVIATFIEGRKVPGF
jgi:hypothetical protein